jgi:hypothetical protein
MGVANASRPARLLAVGLMVLALGLSTEPVLTQGMLSPKVTSPRLGGHGSSGNLGGISGSIGDIHTGVTEGISSGTILDTPPAALQNNPSAVIESRPSALSRQPIVSSIPAAGVRITNDGNREVYFSVRPRDGAWATYTVGPGWAQRIWCDACTTAYFEFQMQTRGREPIKYTLMAGRSYAIRWNGYMWDVYASN